MERQGRVVGTTRDKVVLSPNRSVGPTPENDTRRPRPASCDRLRSEAIAGADYSADTRWLVVRVDLVGEREAGSTDRREEGRLHGPNGLPVQGTRHGQQAE